MRGILLSAVVSVMAAGAAAASLAPEGSRQVAGDYARVAACAYDRLRGGEFADGLQYVDLRGTRRIEIGFSVTAAMLGQATSPVWRLDIAAADRPGVARLAIAAVPTVWGADYYPRRVWAAIAPCLGGPAL